MGGLLPNYMALFVRVSIRALYALPIRSLYGNASATLNGSSASRLRRSVFLLAKIPRRFSVKPRYVFRKPRVAPFLFHRRSRKRSEEKYREKRDRRFRDQRDPQGRERQQGE